MRHRRHRSRLNRTTEHRKALMRNLAIALIEHEIIKTTEAKAKQLRQVIERLVTIAKDGLRAADPAGVTLAKRRLAFSYLQDKDAVKRLFDTVAPRCMDRAGGYTRVVKCGRRMGDGAPMAYIEFVDRPVIIPEVDEKNKPSRTKRSKQVEASA
ncbi:MAG: 50S ribosomal protein L17 [Candidatus Sumerlaeaceae bacterium]|nr:50S ribosomal protein L17 [Candidatus Sumerlaeaceae bacterium]